MSSLPPLRLGLLAGSLLSCKEPGAARNTECAVCMDAWDATSHIIVHVQCRNGFHLACMDDWINQSSRNPTQHLTCPICRGIFPLDNSEQFTAYGYWKSICTLVERVHSWAHISYMQNWFLSPSLYADLTASTDGAATWEEYSEAMTGESDRSYALSSVRAAIQDYESEVGRLILGRVFYNRVRVLRLVVANLLATAERQIFLGMNLAQVKNHFSQKYGAWARQLTATANLAPEDVQAHKFKNGNSIIQMRQVSVLCRPKDPSQSVVDAIATAFYQQMRARISQLIGEFNDVMNFYLARLILNIPQTDLDADLRTNLHHLVTEFGNTPFVSQDLGRIALMSDKDRLKYEFGPLVVGAGPLP